MYTRHHNNEDFKNRKDFCGDKFNHKFDKFREGFFNSKHPMKEVFAEKMSSFKPVNISENEEYYALQLFAAGLKKEAFTISVKDRVLTISYKAAEDKEKAQYIYQEVYSTSFERSFQLNEKVASENISAGYEDGILTVILPKDPENNIPAQEIKVS
ncbi:Hsp20/alpha crystallin family protein [Elizabethkingia meningoseptica]|uniref:Hsp20/alpha crystallin family protein n=1 Tax=Elizabethkingia meningoseptica TaxID=238 RepID=UPI000332C628|nr:Hsp20/alpha crystallin family protein [Elizabethkingia meningoseptica]AQX04553.1 heat-shock protein Hsp20 [Elizabethkingia meningoseptica]AQX46596.1 heat-shock protein Hsp20 [Elizabethkingia meningoseptica]EJK5328504.1 Hsp20/alpha crystallin family protein [Elizabethkingia meningoseptica]EJK5330818.1 Hsp20/alpha crystallin family protein [Elizabethkingia meningoseptica]EOR31441.1 heat shock protein Hsp20 [Elizabethkingia meningoseptica ATCC 13253 = NBRC 12535]